MKKFFILAIIAIGWPFFYIDQPSFSQTTLDPNNKSPNIILCQGNNLAVLGNFCPSFSASQTSCTAPCPVFFDATATISTATSHPFHDLAYAWNFGDSGAGTWSYGSSNSVDSCGGGMGSNFTATVTSGSPATMTVSTLLTGSVQIGGGITGGTLPGGTKIVSQASGSRGQAGNAVYNLSGSPATNSSPATYTTSQQSFCSAIWNTSKNAARGPVAAHIFDTPGTYTVSLTVSNGTTSIIAPTMTITVADPATTYAGTATVCVSSSGTPTAGSGGCPSGATVANLTECQTIMSTYAGSSPVRIMLKTGDTFTTTNNNPCTLPATSSGLITSYGAGAQPIIQQRISAGGEQLTNASGATNWTINGLEFDANNFNTNGFGTDNAGSTIFLYNVTFVNTPECVVLGSSINNIDALFINQMSCQNLTSASGGFGYGIFMGSCSHCAFMGNDIENVTLNEHVVRFQHHNKMVFNHNYLARAGSAQTVFTERGAVFPATNGQTVTSDNVMVADLSQVGMSSIQPESSNMNEQITDSIFEQNMMVPSGFESSMMNIEGYNISIRNNIANMSAYSSSNSNGGTVFSPGWTNAEAIPQPTNLWIRNNTVYAPNASGEVDFVSVSANASQGGVNAIQNDILYGASLSPGTILNLHSGASIAALTKNGNSGDSVGSTTTDPKFTNGGGSFLLPSDFSLGAGSYAIHSGTSGTPIFYDMLNTAFPSTPSIGAIQ